MLGLGKTNQHTSTPHKPRRLGLFYTEERMKFPAFTQNCGRKKGLLQFGKVRVEKIEGRNEAMDSPLFLFPIFNLRQVSQIWKGEKKLKPMAA